MLDKFDKAIIRLLQQDGRMTVTALATQVGLSKTPCQIRMKKLEDMGYIKGYRALVDQSKLGNNHIAFVKVSLTDTKSSALTAFNQEVQSIPEIEECHMVAGDFDYLLKVRTSNISTYRETLGEKISCLPYVKQTSSFVVMENVKDALTK